MDEPEAPAEAGFEQRLRRVGLVAGPALALVVYGLSRGGAAPGLAGLMTLAVVWWMTEALPPAVVALVIAAATVLCGVATPKQAFGAFGSPLLFMFVGSFFIAEAMAVHGLGERMARATGALARTPLALLVALSGTAFASCPSTGALSTTLLVANVNCTNTRFEYTPAASQRNGLLTMQIELTQSGESVRLYQEVHVNNAP